MKLAENDEAATADAHAKHRDYYLALAETAAPHLISHDQIQWLDRLDRDHANLRAALNTCLHEADAEPGLRLANALCDFWEIRGHWTEGATTLNAVLAVGASHADARLRTRALLKSGSFGLELGDAGSREAVEQALAAARTAGDDEGIAEALHILAWLSIFSRLGVAALALEDEALQHARAVGNQHLVVRILGGRAMALERMNDDDAAFAQLEEALAQARTTGDQSAIGSFLINLASLEQEQAGDLSSPRARSTEAIAIGYAIGDESIILAAQDQLGELQLAEGNYPSAGRLFAEMLSGSLRIGYQLCSYYAVFGLARVAVQEHDFDRAGALYGLSDVFRQRLDHELDADDFARRDADLRVLRSALGDTTFERAYETGGRLTLADALALVQETG